MLFGGLFQKKASRTLFTRLVRIISLLTFSIVILFTAATLLITWSFETVLFNERLQQAHKNLKNGQSLPDNFKHYNLSQPDPTDKRQLQLQQSLQEHVLRQDKGPDDNSYGRFQWEQSEYHYLVINDGIIVYDTSNVTIIDRAFEDVFLVLAVLLLPIAALTYWIAKVAARYALKPFTQLTQLFIQSQQQATVEASQLQDIAERDVQHIAGQLQTALQQKAQMLEQQVTFNKGMAHELRTPLQVMRHSVELLNEFHPELADSAAFQRLNNAMNRTIRLTNGLLWLTSEQNFSETIDVREAVQNSISSLKDLCETHHIVIHLQVKENFRLSIPAVVLELILFNLFNNVVAHASDEQDTQTEWTISIDKNHIDFINFAVESGSIAAENGSVAVENGAATIESTRKSATNHNFGIGLDLVSRLAERFHLKSSYTTQDHKFIARLFVEKASI